MLPLDPYDELPYRTLPIEWASPERLALTSLLHGGPRVPLQRYRVLELGCGDGAHLLPMAYYRPDAQFVGVDAAARAIAVARTRAAELELANIEFVHADFATAGEALSGQFEFIIGHGIFSWIPEPVRDRLLALCTQCLAPRGLCYLNYNCRPGWNIRGMVRRFLLTNTAKLQTLGARAERARELSRKVAGSLAAAPEHPYTRLLEREFRFVAEGHLSYIAHEFLAIDNHAYWRSEFLALAAANQLAYLADADFNYASGRIPTDLGDQIAAELGNVDIEDTIDLLSYRQLHSPILTASGWRREPPSSTELQRLVVASRLSPIDSQAGGVRMFRHPNGVEVEAKEEPMAVALSRLSEVWPRGMEITALFGEHDLTDDLTLLHRHGLIELRLAEPSAEPVSEPLNRRETTWTGYRTTRYHTIEASERRG